MDAIAFQLFKLSISSTALSLWIGLSLIILIYIMEEFIMENRSLSAFLNPIKVENEMVEISRRFLDEEGNSVKWEIRAIMSEENDALMKKNTRRDKKTSMDIFDRTGYVNDLVVSAVVFPDLKSAELQKAYGTMGEVNLLKKMLTLGEFTTLSAEVQRISGLDEEDDQKLEEVKN